MIRFERGALASMQALLLAGTAGAAEPAARDRYPSFEIAGGGLRLALYVPDREKGYYRGVRFDWSGLMVQAEFRGHTFFGEFRTPHDPAGHDHVSGPAEEFGMDSPPGYAEAAVGEPFLKIGVGLLRKIAEKNYRFFHPYELISSGAWRVEKGPDWAEFTHELEGGPWAYRYTKRITVEKGTPAASFVVDRLLKNTGRRKIETDHYGHNFFIMDGRPVGRGYSVSFSPDAAAQLEAKYASLVESQKGSLRFVGDMRPGASLWTQITGFERSDPAANRVRLSCGDCHVGIEGDLPLVKLVVYATREALCPEPFVRIECPPGAEIRWRTRYTFDVPPPVR